MNQLIVLLAAVSVSAACVDFEPLTGNKIGDKFAITIVGDPEFFIPKSVYTVTIHGSTANDKFTSFNLTSRSASNKLGDDPNYAGWFFLKADDRYTTLNSDCMNTITENDPIAKDIIHVFWTAPQSGCVTFKANVASRTPYDDFEYQVEHVEKQFCVLGEQKILPVPDKKDECCACDDASYQVTIQGLWSNATHPKNFPSTSWLVHFSDFLAATHDGNLKFWREGQIATEGLRQLAEFGSTSILETELREQKKHLRSVAKINGIWYPKVNSNTTTIKLRTDRDHNLFTIASMLGPSPDWFVGVSELNLCEESCTWVENKVLDLYLYDSGTDSGVSYMSANEPTIPQDRVYRIQTDYPEDPRAPFYDSTGAPIKPFARLYLNRDKLIKKPCRNADALEQQELLSQIDKALADDFNEFDLRDECQVGNYSEWSECSSIKSCEPGIRYKIRNYTDFQVATLANCRRRLVIKESCQASNKTCSYVPSDEEDEVELPDEYCKTTTWSEWSECTVTCGIGFMTRTRRFLNPIGNKRCRHIDLLEKKKCMEPPCKNIDSTESDVATCRKTEWSDWSPCIALCGAGHRIRIRQMLDNGDRQEYCLKNTKLTETRDCFSITNCRVHEKNMKEVCQVPVDVGPCRGKFPRWYYNDESNECLPFIYGGCRGNKNNFLTANECKTFCFDIPSSKPKNPPAAAV